MASINLIVSSIHSIQLVVCTATIEISNYHYNCVANVLPTFSVKCIVSLHETIIRIVQNSVRILRISISEKTLHEVELFITTVGRTCDRQCNHMSHNHHRNSLIINNSEFRFTGWSERLMDESIIYFISNRTLGEYV